MSFESEKEGLQSAGDAINLAMSRGAFGFNDIELLANAKTGLAKQYNLLDGGLSAVLGQNPIAEPVTAMPKLAISQPLPEEPEQPLEEPEGIKSTANKPRIAR